MDNSLEIQCALLGAYMGNSDLFSHVEHLIRPGLFTSPVTKKSYEIIKAYHTRGINSDIVLIYKELNKIGIDKNDAHIVANYSIGYLPEGLVKEYVEELFDVYVSTYLSNIFKSYIINASSGNAIEELSKVKDAITKVDLAVNNVRTTKGIKDQFKDAVKRIKGLKSGEIDRPGFSWGLSSLDEKTLGIVQGINIVAASKGGGKSTVIINVIVENVVRKKIPMLFFSMEMTAVEVLTNVIANVKRINSKALRMGDVEKEQILDIESIEEQLNDTFCIDETGGITWQYLEAKVKEHRKKCNISLNETMLVALDYLGLMKNSADESRMTKEEKIEQICTELMRICKNENIALIKLAQFSRDLDKRGNDPYIKNDKDRLKAFRPRMSDLKGSAAIESNAVTILLLYRPEYYQILECDGIDFRGLCEINIAKGRYVSPDPLYVTFKGKYSLFEDRETSGIVTDNKEAF